MSRPVIGITSYVEPASWTVWREVPAAFVPLRYVASIDRAGGLAVVVPPLPDGADEDDARAVLSRLDGLVLSGGVDVEPSRYGEPPHPSLQPSRPDRDNSELMLARVSGTDDVPVLGVCRGMQVMAVAAGGSLEQHLPDRLGTDFHSPTIGAYGEHPVTTKPGSRLREILGDEVTVATYHHQGVKTYPGYAATTWAPDGVVEAFEDPTRRFRLGVQWHPEVSADPRLFGALISAAHR